jgi:hypothetical protein
MSSRLTKIVEDIMYIADPDLLYRYLNCPFCKSIRYHKLVRKEIRLIGNQWWVRYRTTCLGFAPIPSYKRRRIDTECGKVMDRWIPASQWNILCVEDAYAA